MKLQECRKTFYEFSGKLSDNARKLAFAGIAVAWIFKQEKDGLYTIPDTLKNAILLFVISLSLDLLQYIWQTFIWEYFYMHKERQLQYDEDIDFLAPKAFKNIALGIFWCKVIVLLIGYAVMIYFLL